MWPFSKFDMFFPPPNILTFISESGAMFETPADPSTFLLTGCPQDIANAIEQQFGDHLDIYINNAAPSTMAGIGSLDAQHIQKFCLANIQTPALVVDELVKRKMFRKESRIVLISSVRGRKPNHKTYVYAHIFSTDDVLTID